MEGDMHSFLSSCLIFCSGYFKALPTLTTSNTSPATNFMLPGCTNNTRFSRWAASAFTINVFPVPLGPQNIKTKPDLEWKDPRRIQSHEKSKLLHFEKNIRNCSEPLHDLDSNDGCRKERMKHKHTYLLARVHVYKS